MVKRLFFVSCITLLTTVTSFAGNGAAGFDLLRRDMSAATVAMASSTVAFPQNTSFDGNPALAAYRNRQSASAGYVDYPLDLSAGFIAYSQIWREYIIGGRVNYFNYGEFDRTSSSGLKTGTFSANDLHITGSIARKWNALAVGVTSGFLRSAIDTYSATAYTLSAGTTYETPLMTNLRVGASIENLGVVLKEYTGAKTELPTALKAGFAKRLEHLPVTLTGQLVKYSDSDPYFSGGGEFDVTNSFKLRGGYSTLGTDQRIAGASEAISGLSAGCGIGFREYQFDLGYAFQGVLGDRMYLQFNWLPPLAE